MQNKTIVEGPIPYAVGEKLRGLRLKKSMGLVELGRHTAWDSTTFSPTNASDTVVAIARRSERIRFPDISSGLIAYHFESLDFKATERKLNAFYADFQPVAAEKLKMHTHAGVELIYLIRGKLELCIGSEIHALESGDAIYFDSAVRHMYRGVGKKPCSGVVVTSR